MTASPSTLPHSPTTPEKNRHHTVLAVDLGTGGPKTAVVSLSGEVIGSIHTRVEPTVGIDGSATQDPNSWWDAIVAGTAELSASFPESMKKLVAVAVTGQWGSTVPVDSSGHAVGDAILWMDSRGGKLAARLLGGRVSIEGFAPRKVFEWIRRSGGAPSTDGKDPFGQRLIIEHETPDVYRRTATFLEPIDYINARLCGRVAASQTSMLLSWLTDNRRLDRVAYDPVLLELAGVDASRLPPLLATGSTVGAVTDPVARQLGLPDRGGRPLPVVTALPDLLTAALGSGAIDDYAAHLSISTSSWIGCHTPRKATSITRQMATVPSALTGRYILANNHETAGVCVEWIRNLLVTADDGLTTPLATTLADLDQVASTALPGSGGVLFAPWLNGERSPVADATLRGGFHNVGLSTTRPDLVRSVLEGVAHNARWLLEASESFLRRPFSEIRLIGGGAQSDLWCQIHADVVGRPLTRVEQPLTANVVGAALFAGLSLGLVAEADIAERVSIDRRFVPTPQARSVHQAMHAEFVRLPRSEKGMYRRLNGKGGPFSSP